MDDVNDETKPPPSSPARAIESTPRFRRIVDLAKSIGWTVDWNDPCQSWVVLGAAGSRAFLTPQGLEEFVVLLATKAHRRGIAAGEALTKWREGR